MQPGGEAERRAASALSELLQAARLDGDGSRRGIAAARRRPKSEPQCFRGASEAVCVFGRSVALDIALAPLHFCHAPPM